MPVMCQKLHFGGLQKELKIEISIIIGSDMLNAFFTRPG